MKWGTCEDDGARARDAVLAMDKADTAAACHRSKKPERLREVRVDGLGGLVDKLYAVTLDGGVVIRARWIEALLSTEVEHVGDPCEGGGRGADARCRQ